LQEKQGLSKHRTRIWVISIKLHTIKLCAIIQPMRKKSSSSSWPFNALALDHQLCFALYSASLAMTKLYKPLLAELGLTYPQYLVMLALWGDDGLSVSTLGDLLHLDSGTLTPLLKRLETNKLVSRVRDAADERRVCIVLTAQGRALKNQAQSIPGCVVAALQCSVPEVISITQQVQQLRARLQSAQAA
jgi:MarR family transcriptional regulator, organic hydroperoxide resistance regulator